MFASSAIEVRHRVCALVDGTGCRVGDASTRHSAETMTLISPAMINSERQFDRHDPYAASTAMQRPAPGAWVSELLELRPDDPSDTATMHVRCNDAILDNSEWPTGVCPIRTETYCA